MYNLMINNFFWGGGALQAKSGLGLLSVETSRSHKVRNLHTHTHTPDRTSLNESSALRTGRCLYNTPQTQQTNIHALSRIRISSNRAALDSKVIDISSAPALVYIILLVPIRTVLKIHSESEMCRVIPPFANSLYS